ncbi:hypothetical protein PW52_06715 [Tamlana sedimentorum]|uniref:DUF2752 domain-containing protein n=1 Tax=Neotamlana sedimentorum TaxID=1435349 RepID=A0A0D7WEX6_9FLAO|nr:DUF2752 domain-containing protein [Tamlana sedimentorum]KJD36277.1 hypothetical protein PW52_06715 [Tamlana sedimentorum]
MEKYMLPCLAKKFLGIDCPGCGIQRATLLIFKGEFTDAFHMYPAIYLLVTLFSFILINFFFKFNFANRIINPLANITIAIILISYIIKLLN